MPVANAGLPPEWTEVLSRVQNALTQAEKAARTQEAALAQAPPADPRKAALESSRRECVRRLQERLQGLEARARQAIDETAATEFALSGSEDEVRRWLEAVQTLAPKLAAGATAPI